MKNISEILSSKLKGKGLMPIEITRLILDVAQILEDGLFYNARTVRRRLRYLGWDDDVMDSYVLELMIFHFESQVSTKVGAPSPLGLNKYPQVRYAN